MQPGPQDLLGVLYLDGLNKVLALAGDVTNVIGRKNSHN